MADPAPSSQPTPTQPGHACQIFRAADIFVTYGSNQGDDLAGPDAVDLGDVYQLDRLAAAFYDARARFDPLTITANGDSRYDDGTYR